MMKPIAILASLLLAAPVAAQDFSVGSQAKSWNLYAEKPARFDARVVDLLCELTGDCPADCGAGKRQLALIRTADGAMVLPVKNGQPLFSGAARDLAAYCNKPVEVDGLMIEDPDLGARNIFQIQLIREPGGDWTKANQFTRLWAKDYPEAKGKGPWYRRSPRIRAQIAEHGYLGLGPEADAAFIKEWFE